MNTIRNTWQQITGWLPVPRMSGWKLPVRVGAGVLGVYIAACIAFAIAWDQEPELFSVQDQAARMMEAQNRKVVTGVPTTSTMITIAELLLDKRGGSLSNDVRRGLWVFQYRAHADGRLFYLDFGVSCRRLRRGTILKIHQRRNQGERNRDDCD